MITIPGHFDATLELGFTEVLSDVGLVGFHEESTLLLCQPFESFPSRFVQEVVLLCTNGTHNGCILSNCVQWLSYYLPILLFKSDVVG